MTYYTHQFHGIVYLPDEHEEYLMNSGHLGPNDWVGIIDRDGEPGSARVATLTPIVMQDPEPSDTLGEEIHLTFSTKIAIGDVVGQLLAELHHNEIIDLVKVLDERAQDWDITNALYEHFKKEHEIYLDEIGDENE